MFKNERKALTKCTFKVRKGRVYEGLGLVLV